MPSAHLHLMVRAEINNPPEKGDLPYVERWIKGLVEHVRMKELRPASALWCDEPGNEGITADVLLTTSNAIVHIWNDTGLFEFDLYSCAPYTADEVVDYIKTWFDVRKIAWKFIDRSVDLVDIEKGP